jgi:hypothetical protein
MAKLTPWRKGPPPCVGWWNASVAQDPLCRRYWNGERWSRAAYVGGTSDERTEKHRLIRAVWNPDQIEWRGLAKQPKA